MNQQAAASRFFAGPYRDFSHALLAHASGQGFLMGAVFGVVAIIAAVFLINVKKTELPSDPTLAAAALTGCNSRASSARPVRHRGQAAAGRAVPAVSTR